MTLPVDALEPEDPATDRHSVHLFEIRRFSLLLPFPPWNHYDLKYADSCAASTPTVHELVGYCVDPISRCTGNSHRTIHSFRR